MRKIFLSISLALLSTGAVMAQNEVVEIDSRADTVGYVVGWTYGDLITNQGLAVNTRLMTTSVADRLQGESQLMSKEVANNVLMKLQMKYQQAIQASGGNPQNIDQAGIFGAITNSTDAVVTWNDSLSYAIGQNIGESIEAHGYDMSTSHVLTGLRHRLAGGEPVLDAARMDAINQELIASQKEDALKRGKEFLARNAEREEVTVLPSGLQYEVITPGTGAQPTAESSVTVHYTGTLIDGKVFDSSIERGEPVTFDVTGVIAGWTEALQLMKAGSKWKLYIPSNLAYGERGAGNAIGPNETLVFEVELLEVN